MSEGKIKVVLTDLGNVVVLANHVVTHAHLVREGVPYKLAKQFFTIPEYADFARGKCTGAQYYFALLKVLDRDRHPRHIRFDHDIHMYAVDEDVCDLIERIAEDIPLAVATDTNIWQTRRVEQELLAGRKIVAGKVFR